MDASMESQFRYETSNEAAEEGKSTVRVICHGRLIAGTTQVLREAVLPLLGPGKRTIVDCTDLQFVDSMGLGALVALKVSSLHIGGALEFVNLSPRVKELLRITKLTEYLARPDTINYGD